MATHPAQGVLRSIGFSHSRICRSKSVGQRRFDLAAFPARASREWPQVQTAVAQIIGLTGQQPKVDRVAKPVGQRAADSTCPHLAPFAEHLSIPCDQQARVSRMLAKLNPQQPQKVSCLEYLALKLCKLWRKRSKNSGGFQNRLGFA